jgi:PAS domain S-box-containing protein
VRDDLGAIGGVLVMSMETTARVLASRRQHSLDVLRERLAGAGSEQALAQAAQAVALDNPDDLCGVVLTSAATGTASDADAVAVAAKPLQLAISAKQVGVDVDLTVVFQRSATLPFDSAYRLFLEQFTILVAAARHRIDSETRRLIVEAERDRLLLDAPVGAAVMIGEALVYHLVNPIYAAVSGRPAAEMVGRAFVEVFPELRGTTVHQQFQKIYRSGEAFISEPTLVTIHRHGGELEDRYFTYNLSPLRTLAGQVYGLMVIAVDITTQVRARAEVERLNRDLQASANAKDEFLALLGHELRNPLAPIVTALELMRLREHSSHREQVIIRRQVKHLTRLVDDLLDVSRITRGKVELRKELVDVKSVLLRAVDMVTPILDEKQQDFRSSIQAMQWYGDPARLAQMVSNLLTNAARYSERGANIGLNAGAVEGMLEIEVTDDGIGIPAELLPKIFEPFVQGERKLRSSAGGLGVGLALVKNLAEMHGGVVEAISEGEGKGSTFIVRVPLQTPPQEQGAVPPPAVRAASAGKRLLLVDDNTDAADSLAELLRLHGHTVEVAYSPEVALELFAEHELDVAILDIGLPGMNGYQLAELMRKIPKNPHIRYLALTGFGQEANKAQSRDANFSAHLVKPPQLDDLLELL